MYYLYESKELATGFIYCNMASTPWTPKEGFELTKTRTFATHNSARWAMIRGRGACKKHNLALDSNYLPPSKRV